VTQDVFDFTADSMYGVSSVDQAVDEKFRWYSLDIDRFDALSFDMVHETDGLDTDESDEFIFVMEVFNVHTDGSLELLLTTQQWAYEDSSSMMCWVRDGSTINIGAHGTDADSTGSYTVYYEDKDKVVFQMSYKDADETERYSVTIDSDTEDFTKEFYFTFNYYLDNGGDTNEEIIQQMAGFDLVRKDWLGDIAGAVLDPLIGALAIVFAPFFAIINFIGFLINKGFGFVVALLTPVIQTLQTVMTGAFEALGGVFTTLFEALGTVLDDALGVIGGFIDDVAGFIEDVATAIGAFAADIVAAVLGMIEDLIDEFILFAEDLAALFLVVLDFLFVLLLDSIELIITLITAGVFWIWDAIGLPDILAIADLVLTSLVDVVTGVPQLIIDLTTIVFELGTIALVIWWVWLALPAFYLWPSEAIGEMLDRFMTPLFPWDILGVHFYFPQGIAVFGLTFFMIIVPAGFVLW